MINYKNKLLNEKFKIYNIGNYIGLKARIEI